MSNDTYADKLWFELEAAWDLSESANALPLDVRSDAAQIWTQVFLRSSVVDASRPISLKENSRLEVFCNQIYGIYYNQKICRWIPFRHGNIDLTKIN